jgi:O-methyltransferase
MTHLAPAKSLYLDLLKRSLINLVYLDKEPGYPVGGDPALARQNRLNGLDWPPFGVSMVGWERLSNLQALVEQVMDENIPGDLMETGVWRGGASILMRGILAANGDPSRSVWLADSFEGLPPPKPELYVADAGDTHFQHAALRVGVDEVRSNFERFSLMDERVHFWKGFFSDNLHLCPVERLSLLRLDADMYESTIVALRVLWDRLSPNGFVIVDDYGYAESCRQAIADFEVERGFKAELVKIDWTGVYFRKPAA